MHAEDGHTGPRVQSDAAVQIITVQCDLHSVTLQPISLCQRAVDT